MANEMVNAIKGNPIEDIRAVAVAGDTKIAAEKVVAAGLVTAHTGDTSAAHAASAISVPASTGAGAVYTATDVDAALLEIAGAGRSTETVKATYDKVVLTDLYPIIVVGGNTTSAAVFTAIGNKPTNRTPAVGDEIVMIVGVVTATGVPVASPTIVATDAADGVVKLLALDTTVKVKWGRSSGADLSANTYTCWVKPA